ncbi:MAG: DUF4625 domain-containing protein [Flavobacteriales bacterium]
MKITMTYSFYSLNFSFLALVAILLASCKTTDIEPPTLCTPAGTENSVLADEIEAMAGTTLTLTERLCDNEELSQVRWDIHNAADHAHEEGEDEEGFVLHSGASWELLEIVSVSGTEAQASLAVDLPLTVRGVWDIVVSIVDIEGNVSQDLVTQLHIENDHLPEFFLSSVNGVNPDTWEGEQIWSAGSEVTMQGSVSDTDGLETVILELIQESSESVLWDAEWTSVGNSTLTFDEVIALPSEAAGECHFEMHATDVSGHEVETGFHVEIE